MIRLAVFLTAIPINLFAQTYDFSFAVIGDPQLGFGQTVTQDQRFLDTLVARINRGHDGKEASFTIIAGDIVNHGDSVLVYRTCKQSLDNLDSTYYIVPGNHDCLTDGGENASDSLYAVFGYPPAGVSGDDSVYSFVYSNWFVVGVNTGDRITHRHVQVSALSRELRLAENSGKYGILFSHFGMWIHPEGFQASTDVISNAAAIADTIHGFENIKLVIGGHRHLDFCAITDQGREHDINFHSIPRPTAQNLSVVGKETRAIGYFYDCYNDGSFTRVKIL